MSTKYETYVSPEKLSLLHMIMYNQKLGEGYSFFKYRALALHIESWV